MATRIVAPVGANPETAPVKGITKAAPSKPTHPQVVAMLLEKAIWELTQLTQIRVKDEHWSEVDVHVDYTTEMVLEKVKAMQAAFDLEQFEVDWAMCASALTIAKKSLSRHDCFYGRWIKRTVRFFDVGMEIAEFADFTTPSSEKRRPS